MTSNPRYDVDIKVNIDKRAVDSMLNHPRGSVGLHMRRKAEIARVTARARTGKRSGALAMSIYIEQSRSTGGQELRMGSRLPYAFMHHEGTRPHLIHSRDGGMLRFTGRARIVYTRVVVHPGTRPNRYLSSTLPLIVY